MSFIFYDAPSLYFLLRQKTFSELVDSSAVDASRPLIVATVSLKEDLGVTPLPPLSKLTSLDARHDVRAASRAHNAAESTSLVVRRRGPMGWLWGRV